MNNLKKELHQNKANGYALCVAIVMVFGLLIYGIFLG